MGFLPRAGKAERFFFSLLLVAENWFPAALFFKPPSQLMSGLGAVPELYRNSIEAAVGRLTGGKPRAAPQHVWQFVIWREFFPLTQTVVEVLR